VTVAFQLLFASRLPRSSDLGPPEKPSGLPPPLAHERAASAAKQAAATIAEIDDLLATVGRRALVECRSAAATATVDVDRAVRVITCLCVPYESPALVHFRGQVWTESFARGAFQGIGTERPVRANRDHDRSRTVGRVVRFDPDDPRGLIAEIRIVRTVLGDETLALAADDCLSASVGFGVPKGGEQLDHRAKTRRITQAVLDHVSLVSDPAYVGAGVLAVG
jgi:HK97 family phage prohead protease